MPYNSGSSIKMVDDDKVMMCTMLEDANETWVPGSFPHLYKLPPVT